MHCQTLKYKEKVLAIHPLKLFQEKKKIKMKAKLAFYKGKGNWVDLLIRVFTHSKYSHVEIVHNKDWYSSSPRDGGVRVKQIVDDGNGWDFVEVDIDKERLYQKYREYGFKAGDIYIEVDTLKVLLPVETD